MSGHDEQGLTDPPPARSAHATHDARRGKRGEARLPPAIGVLVAIGLYALLPEPLLVGPRFLIPSLELALLVALIATNPWRMTKQTRWSRVASLARIKRYQDTIRRQAAELATWNRELESRVDSWASSSTAFM